jgi:hypothetical protein
MGFQHRRFRSTTTDIENARLDMQSHCSMWISMRRFIVIGKAEDGSALSFTLLSCSSLPLTVVSVRLALYHRVDATGVLQHVGILVLVQRRYDGSQLVRRGDRRDGIKLTLECSLDAPHASATDALRRRCIEQRSEGGEPMMAVRSAGEAP